MAQKKNLLSRFRLVYRRSSPLLKASVIACIVLAIIALVVIRDSIVKTRAAAEEERIRAAKIQQENAELEKINQQKGSIEWNEQVAQDQLGLLPEGAEIITFEQEQGN